ncbi:MAG: hypothetical protein JWO60_72 [Frankiales bacterium]|nr:hypothetical protein [Frankiales bacterium]
MAASGRIVGQVATNGDEVLRGGRGLMSGLSAYLQGLSDGALLGLLEKRQDVLLRGVSGFDALSGRLGEPSSCLGALRHLDAGAVQVLGLLVEERLSASARRLTALLERTGPVPDGHVEEALDRCASLGLAWPDGATWRAAKGLSLIGDGLLGTGPSLRSVLEGQTLTVLRPSLQALGLPPARSQREALAAVCGVVEAPSRLREVLAQAPDGVAELLEELATTAHGERLEGPALAWLLRRDLVLVDAAGGHALPSEVARLVRGERKVGVVQAAPALPLAAVPDPAETAVRALALVESVRALLDLLDADPPKPLASGGLGAQVQRRLAKALAIGPLELCWLLDLAGSAGLVACGYDAGRLTQLSDQWRSAEPEAAYVQLVSPALRVRPGPRAEGEQVPPLGWGRADERALVPLPDVAADLARIGRPVEMRTLLDRLVWKHWSGSAPRLHRQLLGEQLTQLGRLCLQHDGGPAPWLGPLLEGEDAEAAAALLRALPPTQDDAVWQADGTAVVTGRPSQGLRSLLDACATRESDRTWRLSPQAARTALDAGRTAAGLLEELRARSRHPFPQVLEQLVRDVGAKHGRIHVVPAQTTLQVADPVLLVELRRDRRLASLGLVELAPGLLASPKKPADVLAALRKAGHAPTGPPDPVLRPKRAPAASRPSSRYGPSPQDVLQQLRGEPSPREAPAQPAQRADAGLAARLRHLTEDDQELLLEAWLTGAPVEIDYVDQAGRKTTRVVDEIEDTGHLLQAWCELRDDERMFDPARIQAVREPD